MIVGIGLDIADIERITKACGKQPQAFVKRILSEREFEEFQQLPSESRKYEYLAGRFAAKEALAKAFGTGIGKVSFCDLVILKDAYGKPVVTLEGNAKELARELEVTAVWVSITHDKGLAIAQAILEK
ncbi:hypothetical protein BHU72_06985 [Desulfuribacillus stibiiarsenatis]|uniref:Holo-[acyl-carrier-protein] synthase n=1 Tax=Desulfuribacillus stibiiarsenatis TaxID=1390249 RepID=A0A1E5L462_9FIRM|nr:holo-ACP synthase [Desulfuribacillus stibiiarsenatis]OEH84930.1 hypothetical protein BHU72_06985 [Desulfuribacillus stibiiarsenatis]